MGKKGKSKRKRRRENESAGLQSSISPKTIYMSDAEKEEHPDLSVSNLETATETLRYIIENVDSNTFSNDKRFKSLRGAIHTLHSMTGQGSGFGNTLSGRISDALRDGRYLDAITCLKEMRARGQRPKLGALQRWVRECDAASTSKDAKDRDLILKTLDAIMRTTSETPSTGKNPAIRQQEAWKPPSTQIDESMFTNLKLISEDTHAKNLFRVVHTEKGSDRRPPNRHDAILYTSIPGKFQLNVEEAPKVIKYDVPHVEGAFVMANVFTETQTKEIISACEQLGFCPDEPIDVGSPSILAHNVYWLADTAFCTALFQRCKEFLPGTVDRSTLHGLNPRWRVYRYVPGAVYRPHIDGAWPESGLDPETREYVHDMNAKEDTPIWSKLTFLIRLNHDFQGGETTYFIPSEDEGYLDARPVLTHPGSVVCFPHGDARGSLLHEGSPVKEGTKYIIRTDVLYKAPN